MVTIAFFTKITVKGRDVFGCVHTIALCSTNYVRCDVRTGETAAKGSLPTTRVTPDKARSCGRYLRHEKATKIWLYLKQRYNWTITCKFQSITIVNVPINSVVLTQADFTDFTGKEALPCPLTKIPLTIMVAHRWTAYITSISTRTFCVNHLKWLMS